MDEDEPTQTTSKGAEIPVPTRKQVLDDFAKVVRPISEQPKKKGRKKRT